MNRSIATIAIASCLVMAAACSQDPQEHLRRGNEYLQQKKYQEAIVELKTAVQADPKLAEARVKLADAYLATNDPAKALGELVRAADLKAEDNALQLRTGNLLLRAREFEDAKNRADRVLARGQENPEAQILRGNALAGLKQFDAAISEYEDVIATAPSESAYLGVGTINLQQGRQQEAEAAFRKAVEISPRSIPARIGLAHFYLRTGRPAECERELKAALMIEPANLVVNRAMAVMYLGSGRATEAEPYLKTMATASKTPAARLTLAQYYLALKRRDDARRIYEELATDKDLRSDAMTRLAVLDILDGETARGKARLEEVLKATPQHQGALLAKGDVLFGEGKYDEALALAKQSIAQPTPSYGAHTLAGRVYEVTDRVQDAVVSYEEALKANNRAIVPTLRLATIHYAQGASDKAQTYAQQALSIQPNNREAFALLARLDMRTGKFDQARRRLTALQKVAPSDPLTYALQAEIQVASKQPAAARASYEKILQVDPNNFNAIASANQIDNAAGRHKEAIARVEGALARTNRAPSLLVLAARSYGASGNTAKAEALLKEAIDREPAGTEAYSLLGQWYTAQGRATDAIRQFEEIARRNPKSAGAHTLIGMLLESQGKTAEAEKRYEQALSIDARAAVAANNLAWIYAESDRNLDRALELAQNASRQHPNDPQIADTLGWVYVKKDLAPVGLPHLMKADSKSAVVQYHRGMAYLQTGDEDGARRSLKTALSLQPTFAGADKARSALAKLEVAAK
jgi:tetratricopeptide (TPR) repeat protein